MASLVVTESEELTSNQVFEKGRELMMSSSSSNNYSVSCENQEEEEEEMSIGYEEITLAAADNEIIDQDSSNNYSVSCEIQEEEEEEMSIGYGHHHHHHHHVPLDCIEEEITLAAADNEIIDQYYDDQDSSNIYVAVLGKSHEESSMEALVWTLKNAAAIVDPSPPSTILVYLIHVFPEIHYIPTPLGKLPIGQVNPEQKEKYLTQESGKRRDFLQKFIDACISSKVKVETILIESDMEAKAILDLIGVLNIKKLVIGISKSNLRKLRSRKGNETADQMMKNVPKFCELNIVCEGKQVVFDEQDQLSDHQSPSPSPHPQNNNNSIVDNSFPMQEQNQTFTCSCFRPKADG